MIVSCIAVTKEAKSSPSGLETWTIWKWFCHTQKAQAGIKKFVCKISKESRIQESFWFPVERGRTQVQFPFTTWAIHRNCCQLSHEFLNQVSSQEYEIVLQQCYLSISKKLRQSSFFNYCFSPLGSPSDTLQRQISWFIISFLWQGKNVCLKLYSI